MPLLSSPVPSLLNGVSQQAPALRLPSELEAQVNAYASPVVGLGKRPPSKHVKRLGTGDFSSAFWHQINRSTTERYQVAITDGDLFVYDKLTGAAKTVAFPDGKEYLFSSNPKGDFKALTVADYTFIVNKQTEVAMSGEVSPSNLGKALVSVKQGQYDTTYTIKIDGVVATSFVSDASDPDEIQTDFIAQSLIDNLSDNTSTVVTTANFARTGSYSHFELYQAGAFTSYVWHSGDTINITGGTGVAPGVYEILGKTSNDYLHLAADISSPSADLNNNDITSSAVSFTDQYTFTRSGSSIYIEKIDGTAIDIEVQDSYGNNAIKLATDVVQRFSDLPVVAPAGFTTKVVGDTAQEEDDFYVVFTPLHTSQTFANGNWVETIGPGVETTLDLTTMPHVLIHNADDTFTFQEAAWEGREVGDADSSPNPSFVGETIQDIFFFRNRLGVLSRENVITTVASSFFKFFRESVLTILDSDPIDQASTQTQVALLKHALPFNEELLLFSDSAQLVMTATGLLTPTTATINQATDYQADLVAAPVGAGDNIYFAFNRGDFSGVHEYFIQGDTQASSKKADDVTAHVSKYISGTITKFASCTSENLLVALAEGLPNGFYLYKYYWSGDNKLQSSWSEVDFEDDAEVLSADFIDSTLYLVVQRTDGYHLETISFQDGQADTGSTFTMLLDRRLDETQVSVAYNPISNVTTWTLPYRVTDTMRVVIRAGDPELSEGQSLSLNSQSGYLVTATGDFSASKVFIGQVYQMTAEMSPPTLREPSPNGGQTAIIAGHNTVKTFSVGYDKTAYFQLRVNLPGRAEKVKTFSSLGLGSAPAGSVRLATGKLRTIVGSEASRVSVSITSDSHLPCHFSAAEWESHFTQRSQRA